MSELLSYSSTALFDVSVDVDPSDNNKLLGVISLPARTGLATPRPSLHTTEVSPELHQTGAEDNSFITYSDRAATGPGLGVEQREVPRQQLRGHQRGCLQGAAGHRLDIIVAFSIVFKVQGF